MKLFGRKAGRAEARPALSRGGSATGDWPPSYEAQVREGYCRNAVAQRAVRLVAEAVASAPVTASDPGLGALVGARAGGVPVLETVAAQLQLHGNAFVQVLRDADGQAVALYPLRPERVGELWRGRRGTAGGVEAGDHFVLIEADSARAIDLPLAALGGEVRVMASGVGDTMPVVASATVTGVSVAPPAPVALRRDGDTLRWTRRSRAGWRWLDRVDSPLGEEREDYRVTIARGVGARDMLVDAPAITLAAAELAGATVTVRQRGTYGESPPATVTL